ncbi:glutathione S-transferase family protein [Pseudomonas sp. CGJS7]|uniref:glutathione S-transferase family protein n=1 Tax=Pseudomonas sp. CGJS7 TaxID=3109348 RepID=UPI003009D4BD
MYTLYYYPGAASLLVHWLLIEMELEHELRLVDIDAREHKSPEYLALNPNGVVPTLIVDGQPRFEAAALAMSLADRHADAGLAPPPEHPQRTQYNQWMFYLASALQAPLRLWWYPWDLQADDEAVRRGSQAQIEAACERLDSHLAQHGPYLLGERLSAADFYLTMLMRWSRNTPKPAHQWPHLAEFARRMKARPTFAELYRREGLSEWA